MAVDQQQMEKQGTYDAKASLSALLSDLDEIENIIATTLARRKMRARLGIYTLLAGVLGAVLGAAASLPFLLAFSVLAIVFGLAWWIYSWVSGSRLVAHRGRMEIARQRIAMIQQDAAEKSPFSFHLALTSNPVRLSEEAWIARKRGKQSISEDSWFSLEGTLLDGTLLSDQIKDLIRKRTYTNPRGKHKTKIRTTHLVNVRFSYPKELYGDARPAEKALHGEVKVAPSASLRSVRVTEKAIVMKALVASESEITMTAGMLSVGGYRILNLARRLAAGNRGNTQ